MGGPDNGRRRSPLFKDGEPKNRHDLQLTTMGWTPCPNARHLPTQINSLLGANILQVTTQHPTLSIQGLAKKTKQTLLSTEIDPVNWEMEAVERTNGIRAVQKEKNKKKHILRKHQKNQREPKEKSEFSSPEHSYGGCGHLF